MVLRIAIPITAPTTDEARRDMDRASAYKDDHNVQHIFELRMDYMRNPHLSDVEELLAYSKAHSNFPTILTVRAVDEGGRFEGSEKERIALLQRAIDCGAEYVDIENAHYVPLDKKAATLIVSLHNFQSTPDDLDGIYRSIASKNPDIVKIATYAQSLGDSWRMLNLIRDVVDRKNEKVIGICMGPLGMITREHGPSMGSYLTFASLGEGKASAPGQLTVDELTQNWRNLHLI